MVDCRCSCRGSESAKPRTPALPLGVALALGLTLAGVLTGCGDGCEDGWLEVCDEDGSRCFCGAECSTDEECASGEYCLELAVCVGVYLELADDLDCGRQGQACCQVSPEGRPPVEACIHGLRCDEQTSTCMAR